MAEIYSQDAEEITVGLQGSQVCDEAIQAAKGIAEKSEPAPACDTQADIDGEYHRY